MNYTKQGFTLRDRDLTLAGGIPVHVVWSRELPSAPSSVRVYRDALGHWYASFVVTAGAQPYPETGEAIGVDWGVKDIAVTTSAVHDLPHPEFGKKSAEKLARYQRQMARRKPKTGQKPSAGTSGPGGRPPKRTPRPPRSGRTRPASGRRPSSATTT